MTAEVHVEPAVGVAVPVPSPRPSLQPLLPIRPRFRAEAAEKAIASVAAVITAATFFNAFLLEMILLTGYKTVLTARARISKLDYANINKTQVACFL